MDDKKIAFIICTNSQQWADECVLYLQNLEIPVGYKSEVILINNAQSMAAGYNQGMHSSDAKFKFYLHHDVFLVKRDYVKRVIDIFHKHPEIGMLGVMGSDRVMQNACYWNYWNLGQVYAFTHKGACRVHCDGEAEYAMAIDGMLMMTQYDVEWREDLFKGWDFYDISQSFEFIRNGYKVAVIKDDEISCIHDCGYSKLDYYDRARKVFCDEYEEFGFAFGEVLYEEIAEERELLLQKLFSLIDYYMTIDIAQAAKLALEVYSNYRQDNRTAYLKNAFEIYEKEAEMKLPHFIVLGDTCQKVLERYTKYKFLVRRVEFDVDEDAMEQLKNEVSCERISLTALTMIIERGCCNVPKVLNRINRSLN